MTKAKFKQISLREIPMPSPDFRLISAFIPADYDFENMDGEDWLPVKIHFHLGADSTDEDRAAGRYAGLDAYVSFEWDLQGDWKISSPPSLAGMPAASDPIHFEKLQPFKTQICEVIMASFRTEEKKKTAVQDMTKVYFRAAHIMTCMVDAARSGDKMLLIELGKKCIATSQQWVDGLHAIAGVTPQDIEAFYVSQFEGEPEVVGSAPSAPAAPVENPMKNPVAARDPEVIQIARLLGMPLDQISAEESIGSEAHRIASQGAIEDSANFVAPPGASAP